MGKGPEVGGNIEDGWQKARVLNEISTSQASSFLPSLCASIFRCSCLFHSSEMTNQTLPFAKEREIVRMLSTMTPPLSSL